jgi:hypothetical protein
LVLVVRTGLLDPIDAEAVDVAHFRYDVPALVGVREPREKDIAECLLR